MKVVYHFLGETGWSTVVEKIPGFMLERNFVFCACICLGIFMELLVYPVTVLSLYAKDAGFSHMYTELKTARVM